MRDNPAKTDALARPRAEKTPEHRRALPYAEVASCIEAVTGSGAGLATKLALALLVLTASRSGEVRLAAWGEIDLDGKVWEMPAERMKMQRLHRIPLSDRAVGLLDQTKALDDGSGLVIPAPKRGRLALVIGSNPSADKGDAAIYGRMLAERVGAHEPTVGALEAASLSIMDTQTVLPSTAEVLTALMAEQAM